jgi:hypothetical protein
MISTFVKPFSRLVPFVSGKCKELSVLSRTDNRPGRIPRGKLFLYLSFLHPAIYSLLL